MYVVDSYNHRIQRFAPGNPSSPFLASPLLIFCIFPGSNVGITVAGFSIGSGASRSELYYPSAITVTSNQTMFILDSNNYRVLRWQLNEPLGYVVAGGRGSGSTFDRIGISYGMFVDDRLSIYISEQGNHRVTFWTQGNTTAGVLVTLSPLCTDPRQISRVFRQREGTAREAHRIN